MFQGGLQPLLEFRIELMEVSERKLNRFNRDKLILRGSWGEIRCRKIELF
jgi:hypothetical protein